MAACSRASFSTRSGFVGRLLGDVEEVGGGRNFNSPRSPLVQDRPRGSYSVPLNATEHG